ncbi:MAG: helix-turn-helix transcriptional regulator [Desulfobacterales bacterium]|nr:helix-turn-helix transcriptional regulator [Desulfobacterales bacterium]
METNNLWPILKQKKIKHPPRAGQNRGCCSGIKISITTSEISRVAGVNESLIYRYFKDKRGSEK